MKETFNTKLSRFHTLSFLVVVGCCMTQLAWSFEGQPFKDEERGGKVIEGKEFSPPSSSAFLSFRYEKSEDIFSSELEANEYKKSYDSLKDDTEIKKYVSEKSPLPKKPEEGMEGERRGPPDREQMDKERVEFMKGLVALLKKKKSASSSATAKTASSTSTGTLSCAKNETPSIIEAKTNEDIKNTKKVTEKLMTEEEIQKLKDQIRKEIEAEMKDKKSETSKGKITSSRDRENREPELEGEANTQKPRFERSNNSNQGQNGVTLNSYSRASFANQNSSNDQYQQQYQQLLYKYQQLQMQYQMMMQNQQSGMSSGGQQFQGNSMMAMRPQMQNNMNSSYMGSGMSSGYGQGNLSAYQGSYTFAGQMNGSGMSMPMQRGHQGHGYMNNTQSLWGQNSFNQYMVSPSYGSGALQGYYQFSP